MQQPNRSHRAQPRSVNSEGEGELCEAELRLVVLDLTAVNPSWTVQSPSGRSSAQRSWSGWTVQHSTSVFREADRRRPKLRLVHSGGEKGGQVDYAVCGNGGHSIIRFWSNSKF